MKMKLLGIGFICFIFAGLVSADVINVTPGTDKILSAIAGASAGDILELAAGVYWESNTLNTLAGDLTIRGAAGAEVIVHGPTAPAEYSDLMHVYGNLWLDNIIFVGADSCYNGIVNYYGGVANEGDEMAADKNNIYVSNCQFHMIGGAKFDEGAVFLLSDDTDDYSDGLFHPVDTLRVTDCFFYGGHAVDSLAWAAENWEEYQRMIGGWEATTYKGVKADPRQARYVEVRRSTFWMFTSDCIVVEGAYIGSKSDPGAGSDIDYIHAIADHITIYKTWGGDGIQYEWCNANESITNSLAYITGRFCFKAKYGGSGSVLVQYCMGDSASNEDGFSVPGTVFYSQITQGPGCWSLTNPEFNDAENGDFSLDPALSDAVDGADPASPDGPNMGDPHWNDASTFWPNKAECASILAKARLGTGVNDQSPRTVETFLLRQNYPNPFNPSTTIAYSIQNPGLVNLEIYSLTGQKVRILIHAVRDAGSHAVVWDGFDDTGRSVAGGIYLYRLKCGSIVETKKMILLK